MIISELIVELKKAKKAYGDVVVLGTDTNEISELDSAFLTRDEQNPTWPATRRICRSVVVLR